MIHTMRPYILFLSASLLFLFGCSAFEDKYYNISDNELFAYKHGDSLIYTSNYNNNDTFIVSNVKTSYDVSDKLYHYQYQEISLKSIKDSSTEDYSFYNGYFIFGVRSKRFIEDIGVSDAKSFDYTLNGKTLKKVYEMKSSTVPSDIVKIYYTYKYGMIQYNQSNGEFFQLVLK